MTLVTKYFRKSGFHKKKHFEKRAKDINQSKSYPYKQQRSLDVKISSAKRSDIEGLMNSQRKSNFYHILPYGFQKVGESMNNITINIALSDLPGILIQTLASKEEQKAGLKGLCL